MSDFPIFIEPKPRFDIPNEMAFNFSEKDVGEKIKATINYEVVRKTEGEITIESDLIFTGSRRKK